jgi:CBS domain-containing protein
MIRAGEIMTRKVISVSEDTSIRDLCGLLFEARITGAPVVDNDGILVGIVSKDDIVGAYFHDRGGEVASGLESLIEMGKDDPGADLPERDARVVADIMTKDVVTATEDTSVAEICDLMVTKGIHRVPVVREGGVVGIVSALNVIEAALEGKLS